VTTARAELPATPPPRRVQQRPAERTVAQPPAARSTGPLSLDPSTTAATTAPTNSPQRQLTPPAPRLAAVPPKARVSGGNGGGYLVQVSSQRSESDARASFRALQGKYPQVLNGRQAVVRRADLGKRGVFYRAMVGPFGSASEANRLCSSLKAAGGQCIIQRN
jgi:cell division septation protein DedD